jgi:crotonobetainyl-CoA hydratase
MPMEMRTEGPVKTRREGAILEVTLDRPKANAIDLKTSRIMGLVFRDFRDDDSLARLHPARRRARSSSAPAGT